MNCRPCLPILGAVAALLAACGPPGERTAQGATKKESERPPLVRAEKVELRQIRREISTTGFLESEHRVAIHAKVGGRVAEVGVDEGQAVEPGTVLARLDDREIAAAVRQAQVQIQEREARRNLLQLEIEIAQSRIEQAQIERDRTRAEYERNRDMQEGFVSPKVLDESRFAFDSAEKALQVARFNHRKAELDVKAVDAALLDLKAKLEEVQIRQQEHVILSPIRGRVSERWVKGGETTTAADQLFTVVDTENLVAYLSRPQRELPALLAAKEVRFTTDAQPDHEFAGAIDLVSPVVDQSTGSFKLRMRVLPAEASVLRPGMFVRARILTESLRDALMVPKSAVLAEGDRSIVFAIRDGIAHRVELQPGVEERLAVECLNRGGDGLRDDDVVAVSGHEDLKDRTAVEIAKE
jgi:RND family efflux transporter MFP subunit